jgi:hypothetical protein
MFSIDVLQSFSDLKSSCHVDHMKYEIILNIHDVYCYEEVKVDVIF